MMRCKKCSKKHDNQIGICPYCGYEYPNSMFDDKLPKRTPPIDQPPANVQYDVNSNHTPPKKIHKKPIGIICCAVFLFGVLSAVIILLTLPGRTIDLTAKIQRATAEAHTFSLSSYYSLGVIDSQKKLRLYGIHGSGVTKDKTVMATDNADLLSIQSSDYFVVGAKENGNAFFAGINSDNYPENAATVKEWRDIKQVTGYWNHCIGLKHDGTLVASGTFEDNGRGISPLNIQDWNNICEIITGPFTMGLKNDGTVVSTNRSFQGVNHIAAFSQGCMPNEEIFLKNDGTLTPVRKAEWQEANSWDHLVEFCAVGTHMVGLKEDGSVVAVGSNKHGECDVSEWSDIIAVQAAHDCTVGKKADGSFIIATNDELLKKNFDEVVNGDLKAEKAQPVESGTVSSEASPIVPTVIMPQHNPKTDLTKEIDAVSLASKTFAIDNDTFTFIDNKSQARCFMINNAQIKEKPFNIKNNTYLAAIAFSPQANGAGFGIKKDGSVIVLSNGNSEKYDYSKALPYLNNIKDIISYENENTANGNIHTNEAKIVGLRQDGTLAVVIMRKNKSVDKSSAYNSWKDIKSIAFDSTAIIGLNNNGTLIQYGESAFKKYREYKDIAAIPHRKIDSNANGYLKKNGTVIHEFLQGIYQQSTVSNWTNIIAFSENSNFFVGLRKDRTVITDFKSGVEPLDLSDWKDIVAIQANDSLVVGKKSDGTFVLGTNDFQLKKNFESIINRYVGG